ncbi:hypothetical protein CW304_17875 [Bacillus sp. UFRGS-B20]|nr:hypothetical protein CW304_17875 [Bacillus sp. UFRGS-B20]
MIPIKKSSAYLTIDSFIIVIHGVLCVSYFSISGLVVQFLVRMADFTSFSLHSYISLIPPALFYSLLRK